MKETRAALIERENNDPVIRAQKEQIIKELLDKWERWGLIKPSGSGKEVSP